MEGRGVDEERRLCYVGVTRARETLTMTFAKGRMKWGKPRPSIPSRFLMEMRGDTERAKRAAAAAEALYRQPEPGESREKAEPDAKKAKKAKNAPTGKKPLAKPRSGS
jgi:ATP-dependent exoDNAse (exonuclease V) beta subunit